MTREEQVRRLTDILYLKVAVRKLKEGMAIDDVRFYVRQLSHITLLYGKPPEENPEAFFREAAVNYFGQMANSMVGDLLMIYADAQSLAKHGRERRNH